MREILLEGAPWRRSGSCARTSHRLRPYAPAATAASAVAAAHCAARAKGCGTARDMCRCRSAEHECLGLPRVRVALPEAVHVARRRGHERARSAACTLPLRCGPRLGRATPLPTFLEACLSRGARSGTSRAQRAAPAACCRCDGARAPAPCSNRFTEVLPKVHVLGRPSEISLIACGVVCSVSVGSCQSRLVAISERLGAKMNAHHATICRKRSCARPSSAPPARAVRPLPRRLH